MQVEGIGYDFVPEALSREVVDRWIRADDQDSFVMARKLIREEGLLCGGSSGTAVWAAVHAAKHLKKGQRCVVGARGCIVLVRYCVVICLLVFSIRVGYSSRFYSKLHHQVHF